MVCFSDPIKTTSCQNGSIRVTPSEGPLTLHVGPEFRGMCRAQGSPVGMGSVMRTTESHSGAQTTRGGVGEILLLGGGSRDDV